MQATDNRDRHGLGGRRGGGKMGVTRWMGLRREQRGGEWGFGDLGMGLQSWRGEWESGRDASSYDVIATTRFPTCGPVSKRK